MATFPFYQVNVFSENNILGNPVAVVIVTEDLQGHVTDKKMQAFANWTNLSETTFLFPAEDSKDDFTYHLRIFTPNEELPFAGHPTLGSCKAWLEYIPSKSSSPSTVIQKCQIGNVTIRVDEDSRESSLLSFAAPPLLKVEQCDNATLKVVCDCMGLDPKKDVISAQWVKTGDTKLFVALKDAATVNSVKIEASPAAKDLIWGIYGRHDAENNANGSAYFSVRVFAPVHSITEDPITGSFNAGLALLVRNEAPKEYYNTQGSNLGRQGKVFIQDDGKDVWIGGHTQACIQGTVTI